MKGKGRERIAEVLERGQRGPRVGVALVLWRTTEKTMFLLGEGHSSRESIYALPGGHVENYERLVDAALRELREEADVDASLMNLVSVHEFENTEKKAWYVVAGFEGVLARGTPRVMEPDKKKNWGWWSPRDALGLALFEPDRVLIERVVGGPIYRTDR